jgi:trbC/VIRB2 family
MFQDTFTMSQLRVFMILMVVFLLISNPVLADGAAQTIDPTTILDKIINILNGKIARSLAVIALIIMGIGCWYGYFDFRKIGFFMIGIVLVFGSGWIMKELGVGGAN